MGVYNLNYSAGMAQSQNIYLYENISSAIDTSLLSGKNLIYYIRGRETNWIRTIAAYPTDNGNWAAPTYINNDRYWYLRFNCTYPTTSNQSFYDGATNTYRKLGTFVPPVNETFDVDIYYGSYTLNSLSLTKIDGLSIVINLTVDNTFGYIESDNPTSYFTEYTDNDLIAAQGLSTGKPYDNNRDAQYGTQTWNN